MATAQVAREAEAYLGVFAGLERKRERAPEWLASLRRSAMECFAETGFPTTSEEEWRFTNVAPIAQTHFEPAAGGRVTASSLAALGIPPSGAIRLVLVDGRFEPSLSSPVASLAGVHAAPLAKVLAEEPERAREHLGRLAGPLGHPFTALNTALFDGGLLITIAERAIIEADIEIVHVATASGNPTMRHPRVLAVAGAGSQARLVETYVTAGEGVTLTNAVTEVVLGANAVLDHYKLQRESLAGYHVSRLEALLDASAVFRTYSFALGASLSRNDMNVVLGGEGADCVINGLYVVGGTQHVDHHTGIDHAKPHCTSHELFKGILDGHSTGVFNGRIRVRQDAQKTDSKQTNKNLLLSEDALVQTNPQLEIYADDVKCTHGATIGQMDEDALFYLRSRGIPARAAHGILTYAFAAELVGQVKSHGLREPLALMLAERFGRDLGEERMA